MAQLSAEEHRRFTRNDADPLVNMQVNIVLILAIKLILIGGVPFGVYAILQVQCSITVTESWLISGRTLALLSSFSPKLLPALHSFHGDRHYTTTSRCEDQTCVRPLTASSKWKAWTATVATILLATSFAVMEVILIFTLQVRNLQDVALFKWLTDYFRVLMTAVLNGQWCLWQSQLHLSKSLGWYHRTSSLQNVVEGLSASVRDLRSASEENAYWHVKDFWFLLIDYAGAFFSLMALSMSRLSILCAATFC